MKRGWILTISVLVEVVVFTAVCVFPWFLSIATIWKTLITIGGFIATMVLAFLLIYFWWAPNNLFWTFVSEGRFKIVVRADGARKVLIQWKDHVLAKKALPNDNVDLWDIVGAVTPKRFFGGLRFYGWWPLDDIYIYDFQWTGIKETGELDLHPEETLDFGILKDDVYGCKIEKAEDKKLLPLDVYVALTLRIINPYKALFNIQNWFEAVINRVRPYIRDFITTEEYENFIVSPIRIGTEVKKRLEEERILDEFKDRYGIELRQMEVKDIDPGENYREASLAKYLAEREKDRVLIGAEAERERLKKVAQGEAQRIKKVYEQVKQFGRLGELIRTLEAMEKSPGEGSKWVIPIPGMTDLISRVFPNRKPESLNPEDIARIREMITDFQQTEKKEAS